MFKTDEIKYSCAFTGHRPEKAGISEEKIKALLEKSIEKAVRLGFTTFITGMARGTDICAAEIVLRLKEEGKELNLVCAPPYRGFEKGRSDGERERYERIIKCADRAVYVSEKYSAGCYDKRNMWMVDRSSRLIAVFNGAAGGTKNTVAYAKKKGVYVDNVLEMKQTSLFNRIKF